MMFGGGVAMPLRDQVHHVAAGADEAALVADQSLRQPLCLGIGADEDE